MEGTLVVASLASEPAELSELIRQIRCEVLELRHEVHDLRRENAELRQQVGYWKAQHARAVHRAELLEAEVEQLRGENRKLQDQLFGQKSEAAPPRDRRNYLEGEEDRAPSMPRKRGQRKDRPGPKRRDYSHLPVVEDLHVLPENQRVCSQCGAAFSPSGTEDSEQIEIEVQAYRRVIRRRRYQRSCACANCPRTVTAAPAPKLIPKGLLGVSVWVEVLLDKFLSHRPTERLLSQWRLLGLDVAAGTVADGLKQIEPLFQPLYDALLSRNAASAFAQADETRWMVFIDLDGKVGYRWWLWVFLGEDTVVFRLDPTRSHDVPEAHFPTAARVVLMVDRYSAYKAMAQVKLGNVVLVFCWAHVRRDFVTVGKGWPQHKEWALAWLRRIRALYRLDRPRREAKAGSVEFTATDAELRQVVAMMQTQSHAELAKANLPTPCRKVLTSLQEHWTGLTRFLDDPRIPLDNNASERRVRGPALGRKNYYGSGALWSGRLATMLFSLFATLASAKINVRTWLAWFLTSCAENGGRVPTDIDPFLPWKMSHEKRRELTTDPDDSS
ncbi:MAG TPA: IS66 family transposase [Pirellulales bacterium]|jgi:transposase